MVAVLECSSKGDKRFSAFYAKVEAFGKFASIEEHYQLAKRWFDNGTLVVPKTIKDAKGKQAVFFELNGKKYPLRYLGDFYSLLWVKYLDNNPSLVKFANQYDEFTDMFKGKSVNCQADVVKKYVKVGRDKIISDTTDFRQRVTSPVQYKIGDLLKSNEDVIGHQTNCIGAMGAGIAETIKNMFPEFEFAYGGYCTTVKESSELLGECQLIKTQQGLWIANLFGQDKVSRDEKQTNEKALKKALLTLKGQAMANGWNIGLPYKIGSNLGGADWNEVYEIILEVFSDYPVTIYVLPKFAHEVKQLKKQK